MKSESRGAGGGRIVLAAFFLFAFSSLHAADIQLDGQIGFDRQTVQVRANAWSPFTATLRNNGPDVEGVLRFSARGASVDGFLMQEQPLNLPKKSTKQLNDVVFVRAGDTSVEAEFLVKGKQVVNVSVPFQFAEAMNPTVLIVGDEDWVRSIKGLVREELRTLRPVLYAAKLETLPDNAHAYDGIDTVVLDQGEWTRMLNAQADALRAFIEGGGNLVVSTGRLASSFANSPVAKMLPVELGVTEEITQPTEPIPNIILIRGDRHLLVARSSPKPGASMKIIGQDTGGRLLVIESPLGLGRITVLGFQLGDPVLREWPGKIYLWHYLFTGRFAPLVETDTDAFSGQVNVQLDRSTPLAIPTHNQIGILLLLYVVGVIPLNHLAFRLFKRPLWAWCSLPALSVLIGGAIIINERIVTRDNLSLTRVSISQTQNARPVASADSFFSMESPFAARFHVQCAQPKEKNGNRVSVPGDLEWFPIFSKQLERDFLRTMPSTSPAMAFRVFRKDSVAFRASHAVPLNQGLEIRTQLTDGTARGQIDNRTPFDFVSSGLLTPQGAARLGALASGKTLDVNATLQSLAKLTGRDTPPPPKPKKKSKFMYYYEEEPEDETVKLPTTGLAPNPAGATNLESFVEQVILPQIDARQRIVFWALARSAPLELEVRDHRNRQSQISREARGTIVLCEAPFQLSDAPFQVTPEHWRARLIQANVYNEKEWIGRDIDQLPKRFWFSDVTFEVHPNVSLGVDPWQTIERVELAVDCQGEGDLRVDLYNLFSDQWEMVGSMASMNRDHGVRFLNPRTGNVLVRLVGTGVKELHNIQLTVTGQREKPGQQP